MNELEGALGILPPSAGALLAILGTSSKGPVNTPAAYARVSDVVADFGLGPLVEAAAHPLTKFGRPVLLCRSGDTTAGTLTSAVLTGTGTATVDVSGSPAPIDDFEFYVIIVTGGVLGTAGITFKWSLDGGRTLSAETALGTALVFEFPDSGDPAVDDVELTFGVATETLVAGDVITFRSTAPQWDATELTAALTALRNTSTLWDIVHVLGEQDATTFAALDTAVSGMAAYSKDRLFIAHTRIPDIAETEATYKTALDAIFGSLSTVYGALAAGACKVPSGVTGRQYLRPASWYTAGHHAVVSEEVNLANVRVGLQGGVSIVDAQGNPDDHDESVNPGLDDSRFMVLRTWAGRPGVYLNRPRIFSTPTSDYQLIPHRRVINLAKRIVRSYLEERVNLEILVNGSTGYILESEALEIEAGALAALRGALLAKPKASAIEFTVSRTDNLLSTKTMNCECRIIPLAYPEFINVDIGFSNPALVARAV